MTSPNLVETVARAMVGAHRETMHPEDKAYWDEKARAAIREVLLAMCEWADAELERTEDREEAMCFASMPGDIKRFAKAHQIPFTDGGSR